MKELMNNAGFGLWHGDFYSTNDSLPFTIDRD